MKSTRKSILFSHERLPLAAALASLLLGAGAASATDYPTTVLADNPIAYYRLEETSGTTAYDSSASGQFPGAYNFSADNLYPMLGQAGIDTNSILLSGADPSSVTAGYYPEFNQQAPFSFEVWARPLSISATDYRCPIGNFSGWGTATQSGWYVYQTPTPATFAFITQPAGIWISQAMTPLSWYHLVGTYDGTNSASFYINGVLVGTQNATGFVANNVNNSDANTFGIGQRGDGNEFFDGNLDEVAYYTNALTAAQVLNHYQAGTNSFRVGPVPPSILKDVAPVTNYAGTPVVFSVLADGTPPLAYQWYKTTTGGTNAIGGATNDVLTFICTPADDQTSYSVVITNFVGSQTSSVVALTVSTGLLIDAPLTSITRNAGSAAAFEIVAEGALPLSYQWRNGDATPICRGDQSVVVVVQRSVDQRRRQLLCHHQQSLHQHGQRTRHPQCPGSRRERSDDSLRQRGRGRRPGCLLAPGRDQRQHGGGRGRQLRWNLQCGNGRQLHFRRPYGHSQGNRPGLGRQQRGDGEYSLCH